MFTQVKRFFFSTQSSVSKKASKSEEKFGLQCCCIMRTKKTKLEAEFEIELESRVTHELHFSDSLIERNMLRLANIGKRQNDHQTHKFSQLELVYDLS